MPLYYYEGIFFSQGVDPDPTGGFHMNLANQGYAAKGPGFSLRF